MTSPVRKRLGWLRAFCVWSWLCVGCAGTGSEKGPASGAGRENRIRDMNEIPENFMWEQDVTSVHGGQARSFRAVIQKTAGELDVLVLTPFGTRAFLIHQSGTEMRFTAFIQEEVAVSPEAILLDIHRAFFLALPNAPAEGAHGGELNGHHVSELWRGGRLTRRSFACPSGASGNIAIQYSPAMLFPDPPKTVELVNSCVGYQLRITTVQATKL